MSTNEDKALAAYREAAKRLWAGDDDISFDPEPRVATAEEGAWVACWVWVPKEEAQVSDGGGA